MVFSNIFFGTNWPDKIKKKISGFPQPWFLVLEKQLLQAILVPAPPPGSLYAAALPSPTDHPPDRLASTSDFL